jgi:hypothetical protein
MGDLTFLAAVLDEDVSSSSTKPAVIQYPSGIVVLLSPVYILHMYAEPWLDRRQDA